MPRRTVIQKAKAQRRRFARLNKQPIIGGKPKGRQR